MRAFTVLLALVATPFLAGVSQKSQALKCDNQHRSAQGTANAYKGACLPQPPPPVLDADQDGVPDSLDSCAGTALGTTVDASGCALPSTPPPPTSGGACVNSSPAGGTASIDGQVFVDASPWPGLQNWCVQANGPVSATAVTDASGNYLFSGLPAGTYTVCETLQAGWHQTFPTSGPSCANGNGWTITVMDGGGASFIWFGNLTP
jgi:SdrD B-like protein